ncbi:MAG: aminopeptidase P family protein, partial [Rhodobacteraceae bacterium]|nr:aminopeptidase P family protein [Paracoccaceae bacterium]
MNDSSSAIKSALHAERLIALRAAMAAAGVDGYLIPHADEHQHEYLPPYAERLAWLTGFTGSSGMAVVLRNRAAFFTDGRYTLQAATQVDGELYVHKHLVDEPPTAWLADNASGMTVAYDPRLFTPAQVSRFEDATRRAHTTFKPLGENLIDRIWTDQPARPAAPVEIYPEEYAGRCSAEKRKVVAKWLEKEGFDAFLVSATDSVCWLFNIRGSDVEFSPLVIAYGLVKSDGSAALFVDPAKLSDDLARHLGKGVDIVPYDALPDALAKLKGKISTVAYDRDTGSRWLADNIAAAGLDAKPAPDPITPIKAAKGHVELDGVRAAHVRDGAALTKFLAWFAREAPKGNLNEITAAEKLEDFRRFDNLYRGGSFPTICGAGGNGAIVHYRAQPESAAKIAPNMLVLIDSGGQYLDATTDVTRTVAVGSPTPEQRRRFTLVLKGHIALGSARFIKGTTGSQLDALARHALWQEGLDYDHGTGHGVGTYLGVHEGPQRISKVGNTVALEPGMLISNEPGYYKTGEYGIRIENLVVVKPADQVPGAEKPLYEFETVTLAPIDV